MSEPAEQIEKEEDKSCRGMRDIFIDSKKIGEAVDERKRKHKKERPPAGLYGGQKQCEAQHRKETGLEGFN